MFRVKDVGLQGFERVCEFGLKGLGLGCRAKGFGF